jgi:hypothetical protein
MQFNRINVGNQRGNNVGQWLKKRRPAKNNHQLANRGALRWTKRGEMGVSFCVKRNGQLLDGNK